MLRCWTPPVLPGFQWMKSGAVRIGERQRGLAHMGQPPLRIADKITFPGRTIGSRDRRPGARLLYYGQCSIMESVGG